MKKQLTEEQKQKTAERREKMRELWQRVAKLTPDEREAIAMEHGIVTCEGKHLSTNNTCFLMEQAAMLAMETPSVVGGFYQWKQQGRAVSKGQHGMAIWIPTEKKAEATEQISDSGTEEQRKERYFFLGTVFDITQTEAIEARKVA
jgi:hypothetical protein